MWGMVASCLGGTAILKKLRPLEERDEIGRNEEGRKKRDEEDDCFGGSK